jgi:hypothetical protein
MADLVTTYTYATSGGTIIFNNGSLGDGTDKFWIHRVRGLDGANGVAPIDAVPFGDGSIIHTFWKRGRRPGLEGVLIVESVSPWGSACQQALNVMEEALRVAADSNIATSATLSWTPSGFGARSLSVFHPPDLPLEFIPIENFATRSFDLALVSEAADW